MTAERRSPAFVCPVYLEPLRREGETLVGESRGERYPIVDGIPVLIADADDRRALSSTGGASLPDVRPALRFYNDAEKLESYLREALDPVEGDLRRYLDMARCDGPVLEIGSGKGALQGLGGTYVACDYSLSQLRTYIRPEYVRVCATAERLPFANGQFRFVFSIAALEHVPSADRAFAEIDRVLKPGGMAYVAPAWHCCQYNCEGIPVRPYRDLDLRQKFVKATLPIRTNLLVKSAATLPLRAARRARWLLRRQPTELAFERLRPDYETFWTSDSDAASRIDSHEGCLFFHSRGYDVVSPGRTAIRQLLHRSGAVVAQKPA